MSALTTIQIGPALIVRGSMSLLTKEGVTVTFDQQVTDLAVDGLGNIDHRPTGSSVKIAFTPEGLWSPATGGLTIEDDTGLGGLFEPLSLAHGASLFGNPASPVATEIRPLDGSKKLIINRTALTGIPDLLLRATTTPIGNVEITGLHDNSGNLFSWAVQGSAPVISLDPSDISTAPWLARFGPAVASNHEDYWKNILETEDGWTVSPKVQTAEISIDALGPCDLRLAGRSCTISGKIVNGTAEQILGLQGWLANRRGTSMIGGSYSKELQLLGGASGRIDFGKVSLTNVQASFNARQQRVQGVTFLWHPGGTPTAPASIAFISQV